VRDGYRLAVWAGAGLGGSHCQVRTALPFSCFGCSSFWYSHYLSPIDKIVFLIVLAGALSRFKAKIIHNKKAQYTILPVHYCQVLKIPVSVIYYLFVQINKAAVISQDIIEG
jgi:hypothetical protein